MTCAQIQDAGIAEKYLRRELSEADATAFEAHYFHCADCLGHLELLESMRKELQGPPPAVAIKPRMPWIWPSLAAAMVLLAAVLVWRNAVPPSIGPPSNAAPSPAAAHISGEVASELALLARLTPPPYRPAVTRTAQPNLPFEKAMEPYAIGDYASASQTLAPLLTGSSSLPAAFYLGIAKMQLAQPVEAAQLFTAVIARGDTLFLEQARLYRAKAYLRTQRIDDAVQDIEAAISLRGDREEEARQLLRRVEVLRRPHQ